MDVWGKQSSYVCVGVRLKGFVSETPYLIHEAAKAPHVTGCGVLLKMEGLFNILKSPVNYNNYISSGPPHGGPSLPFVKFLLLLTYRTYFRSCPLYWDLPSTGDVVCLVSKVP